MKGMLHKSVRLYLFGLLCFLVLCSLRAEEAKAEEASQVSVGEIDYDDLTMQVFANNNTSIYYSTDQDVWYQAEMPYDSSAKAYIMDISWISSAKDVTLLLKGNINKSEYQITFPMQNKTFKVKYERADGIFSFTDTEDAETFQWRKETDYHWNTVNLEETSASYQKFLDAMDNLTTMGAKIIFRLPQSAGYGNEDEGRRPCKEVPLTIPKRPNAPGIKVNSSKLSLNTTEAMEYYDKTAGLWIDCSKAMLLEDLVPEVLYSNGSKTVTLLIRTSQTEQNPYSKTAYIKVTGQQAAPTLGDNSDDITYYYQNSKLILRFNNASNTNLFEYTIVKPNYEFNADKAVWTAVSSSKLMTISVGSAPDGSVIYVRKKGIDENAGSNIHLVLSSATGKFTVKYP